ncbi:GntR family transcriptional regulator [Shimia sp.]|uniref:GntR family transcriptional regulator n=1 Tax=Shimia sp. TaxID=1954381 RepID=UPI003299DC37
MKGNMKTERKSSRRAEDQHRVPVHHQVYLQLREAVLFGEFVPGQAVTIKGLVELTGAGMTPIREAIRRLTSEGALEFRGNRRVVVPTPSGEDLDELLFLRETLEPKLAALAAERVSEQDLNKLEIIDSKLDDAIAQGDVGAYLRRNYAFHANLYDIAEAPILTEITNSLWLRFGPSMRVVCGQVGTRNLPDNHKQALVALASGNTVATAAAIRADIVQGMEQMRAALNQIDSSCESIDSQ